MEKRDFKGVWIPKEIWLNENLTALDKMIFTEIDSLDNKEHCTAGNEYFAKFCQCSERKVSESIQKLCDMGLIEVLSFDGRKRTLKSLLHSVAEPANESRKICEAGTQNLQSNNIDNNTTNKEDIITINSNNTENRTTTDDVSDFESHGYSKEELKSEFLGSIKKKQPKKRVSLYDKCVDEIYCYTKNIKLQDTLVQYLSVRLAMKDKPIYGVNQFKGMLNRLTELSGESDSDKRSDKRIKIVQQSIEKGWASFYEYKENKQNYNGKYQQNEDVFSEFGQVSCDKIEEEICDEEF